MDLTNEAFSAALNTWNLVPEVSVSLRYKSWVSLSDPRRCTKCAKNHGKIWLADEEPDLNLPEHPNCRCLIEAMQTIETGTATINRIDGADWTLKYTGKLPDYYIDKSEALNAGWKAGKWPVNFVPNKMITGGIYDNNNGHLPQKNGRVWYEADINYKTGKRNSQRAVWSNDGLLFVTYDHYETFYEII